MKTRRERLYSRRFHKVSNHECTICQELIQEDKNIVTTVCDHAYHRECWDSYVSSCIHDMAKQYQDLADVEMLANLGKIMSVAAKAGPPCPNCRFRLPLLHNTFFTSKMHGQNDATLYSCFNLSDDYIHQLMKVSGYKMEQDA